MKSLVIAAPFELKNSIAAALSAAGAGEPALAADCSAAEPLLSQADFVLLVSPRCPEAELEFLRRCGKLGKASLLLTGAADAPRAEEALVLARCLVLAAPLSSKELSLGIRLAKSISHKFSALETRNQQLRQRLEDFKIIDRAKCCLVAVLGMDEERAHRYIQKRAMDMRVSQREIALDILTAYE